MGGQSVFDSKKNDRLEWELNKTCQKLLQTDDGHINCMLSFRFQHMQRKEYSKREARARLRELLSVYQKYPDKIDIVEIEEPIELNQFFIADRVGIESVKMVSGKLYNHAIVIRDLNDLRNKISHFDQHFAELKQLNIRRARGQGFKGPELLRAYILKRLNRELKALN